MTKVHRSCVISLCETESHYLVGIFPFNRAIKSYIVLKTLVLCVVYLDWLSLIVTQDLFQGDQLKMTSIVFIKHFHTFMHTCKHRSNTEKNAKGERHTGHISAIYKTFHPRSRIMENSNMFPVCKGIQRGEGL